MVLDLRWGDGLVLSGLAWRVSDQLGEVLVVAAHAVQSPDAAPGALAVCLGPGHSGVETHQAVHVLGKVSFRDSSSQLTTPTVPQNFLTTRTNHCRKHSIGQIITSVMELLN